MPKIKSQKRITTSQTERHQNYRPLQKTAVIPKRSEGPASNAVAVAVASVVAVACSLSF
jgi:hypothetical protein